MIINYDKGYGQTPEQMIQSLMESTQMALDNLERQIGSVQPIVEPTVVEQSDKVYVSFDSLTPEQKESLKGAKGDPGYTPIKGVDYFDGAKGDTGEQGPQGPQGPQGIQGIQGIQGEKGEQGVQGVKGDTGPQGAQGEQGPQGTNGIPATHSWNGTVLTVTSASGTSSADLKGPKGDTGSVDNLDSIISNYLTTHKYYKEGDNASFGDVVATPPIGTVLPLGAECYTYGVAHKGCTNTTCSSGSSYATLGNPSEVLGIGGTWALVDKSWESYYDDTPTNWFTRDTTHITAIANGELYRSDKSLHFNLQLTNKTAHSDTTRTLGTFKLGSIGVSSLSSGNTVIYGSSDGDNGISMLTLYPNGTLYEVDFVSRATSIPTTTGNAIITSFNLIVRMEQMYDANCNLFYWKRIA